MKSKEYNIVTDKKLIKLETNFSAKCRLQNLGKSFGKRSKKIVEKSDWKGAKRVCARQVYWENINLVRFV